MSEQNAQKPGKKPADWDELYPGRFMKAGQLGDRKITLTIAEVVTDALLDDDGKTKVKGIVRFRETELELALNRTNGLCLREMFGRTLAGWEGRKITLFRGEWKGEPAIRVWGSPELPEDRTIEIKLPRRRPQKWILHAVRAAQAAPSK